MKSLHFVEKRRSCLWGVHWLCIFKLKLGQYCYSTNSRERSEEEDGIGAPLCLNLKHFAKKYQSCGCYNIGPASSDPLLGLSRSSVSLCESVALSEIEHRQIHHFFQALPR